MKECRKLVYIGLTYYESSFFKIFLLLLSSDLVSRANNLVGYNLPNSYLGIPFFTIIITLW